MDLSPEQRAMAARIQAQNTRLLDEAGTVRKDSAEKPETVVTVIIRGKINRTKDQILALFVPPHFGPTIELETQPKDLAKGTIRLIGPAIALKQFIDSLNKEEWDIEW
jgi:hypothetical protein